MLCLKFEGDWEDNEVDDNSQEGGQEFNVVIKGVDGKSVEVMKGGGMGRSKERGGRRGKKGFMVSGSSDCSVCVWDLYVASGSARHRHSAHRAEGEVSRREGDREGEVQAEVRAVLKGHTGGVLDLRIDKKWIVSWCVTSPSFIFLSPICLHAYNFGVESKSCDIQI